MTFCVHMISPLIWAAAIFALAASSSIVDEPRFQVHPIAYAKVPEIIRHNGYTPETVSVTSEDGYIIGVHRIARGKNARRTSSTGPPVILHHGLLSSSASWTMEDPSQGLAYLLADRGYDVWMPNARGNLYSKEHVSIPTTNQTFWEFSWHEMGYYDLPAVIDHILNVTGESQVFYVGHSMGTTLFFAGMASRPEYNSKIRLMSALAPVGHMAHIRGLFKVLAPHWQEIAAVLEDIGYYEFLPYSVKQSVMTNILCGLNEESMTMCEDAVFLVCGYDKPQFNTTLVPYMMGQHPGGTSLYTMIHYAQEIVSGRFCRYDFGTEENLVRYNQAEPTDYDVTQITAPIALYYSLNDWLADPEDVVPLADQLPNVVDRYLINYELFNHMDYLIAKDVVPLVYDHLMDLMDTY